GEILEVEGEQVAFAIDGVRYVVPFTNIDKGRIVPDWAALGFAPTKPGQPTEPPSGKVKPRNKPSKPRASKKK
ncbi:MAG: ribosome maturation factor RimP, partial [Lysobacter sp.]